MSWARIHGHQNLIQSFQGLVQRGRLAHAYLFVGRPGVGKSMFAHELAKAILCDQHQEGRPLEACDQCVSCTLFQAGTHPDFFVIRRPEDKQEMLIAQLREMSSNFTLKPSRAGGKVAILEDADDMNEEAGNCFLKTLEEPPPHSVIILIGSSPDRQLPTILSRCHIVRFAPLTNVLIEKILADQGVEPADRPRLIQAAQGSPGQALALNDPSLWNFRRIFLEACARPNLDALALSRSFIELVEEAGKEAPAQRHRALLALNLLAAAFSLALRISLGQSVNGIPESERAVFSNLGNRAGSERLIQLLERCLAAENQIGFYIQVGLVLEGLVEACARILEENPAAAAISSKK